MTKKDESTSTSQGRPRGTRTLESARRTASGRAPQADLEYDQRFEELVRTVKAELPNIEPEAEAMLPLRIPPSLLRRSGIYTRSVNRPIRPPVITPEMPLTPIPAVPPRPPGPVDLADGQFDHGTAAMPEALAQALGAQASTSQTTAMVENLATADPALWLLREELRVDIDGLHPTMTISGNLTRLLGGSLTWIARVTWHAATLQWIGSISYRHGNSALLPYTAIACRLSGLAGDTKVADVTFVEAGRTPLTLRYRYQQAHFREVGIEFDCTSDATAVTSYNLAAHPNRPAGLPATTLTIESAFTRLGIKMTNTGQGDIVPISAAGANMTWSDVEMHDAMQEHWSQWADTPQWQLWTLFAGQHDIGPSLGGIMFDEIGAAERQGCAIFSNSFISNPPASDPDREAFVQRMRFWTAVHEIGHTFNLLHSWDKDYQTPWIPLSDEVEARSFMNYPYRVSGGADSFFADFHYLFSDQELLFLRHAPAQFVQQGNADWIDHHAFEQARAASSRALELAVRVNRLAGPRGTARFESLEPVVAELKLRNNSSVPVVVDRNCLIGEDMTIIVAREGGQVRRWQPYARYCLQAEPAVLQPGESLYAQCFVSAGRGGWLIAEPGRYQVYAALRTPAGHALSVPLSLRIDPPASRAQERIAPDILSDDVGRVLAFGGSRVMNEATDILRTVVQELPEQPIAIHAAAALGQVAIQPGRILTYVDDGRPRFDLVEPDIDTATSMLTMAYQNLDEAAATLGHIRIAEQAQAASEALAAADRRGEAADLASRLATTLEDRGVLSSVVRRVSSLADRLSRGK